MNKFDDKKWLDSLMSQSMIIDRIDPQRMKEIESFMWDGVNLKLYSANEIRSFMNHKELMSFCHVHGIYQVPTTELIFYLKSILNQSVQLDGIEIGAGLGQIGRHLGIKMTDKKLQNNPLIKEYYGLFKQPTITYPDIVEHIDGNRAVIKYSPSTVLACWVTEYPKLPYGIYEEQLLRQIDTYIFIGNKATHGEKIIFKKYRYDEIEADWLISRSMVPTQNRIWIVKNERI